VPVFLEESRPVPLRALKAEHLLRNAKVFIPAGFLLVLAAILAVAIGLVRSREADMLVLHTFEVRQSAQALLISIGEAETTKRSYLLTGTADYLSPSPAPCRRFR
jgi:CHASE3 domain sensor protein